MNGWIILALYVIGWIYHTRRFARSLLNGEDHGRGVDDGERMFSLFVGAMAALLWPIVAPFYHARFLLIRGLRTDKEIQRTRDAELREKDAELERLRKLARQYDLPMPDVTGRELERRLAEQQAEIARLTAQIGDAAEGTNHG